MNAIISKYSITRKEDLSMYGRLCYSIKQIANALIELEPDDPYRVQTSEDLLNKLYEMGLIANTATIGNALNIKTRHFCQRRLPVVMVRLKMTQRISEAVT